MANTGQHCDQCRRNDVPLHKHTTTKVLSGYGKNQATAEVLRWLCDDCLRDEEAREQAKRVLDYRPDSVAREVVRICGAPNVIDPQSGIERCGFPPDHQGPHMWQREATIEAPEDAPPAPWPTDAFMCGIVSMSGPNGEPLACAYPPNHDGDHSWATLPTFVDGEPVGYTPSNRAAPLPESLIQQSGGSVVARSVVSSLRVDPAALADLAALLNNVAGAEAGEDGTELPPHLKATTVHIHDGSSYQKLGIRPQWETNQIAIYTLRDIAGRIARGELDVADISDKQLGSSVAVGGRVERSDTKIISYSLIICPTQKSKP